MHLSAINIHPVKSLRAQKVQSAAVDALGAIGDRRFLVVQPDGTFLTQRVIPAMATIDALVDEATLTLRTDGRPELRVPRACDPAPRLLAVRIFKSEGLLAEDCGDEAADWLTGALGVPCRLVRAGAAFRRPVLKAAAREGDLHAFADACSFLAISEASLESLNDRIVESGGEPVGMDRFRTNLVLSGCSAFEEDTWKRFRIGDIVFRSAGPSTRCIVTTTDQRTGVRGVEPLRTLARFRRDPKAPTEVMFGQNLVHESLSGTIRVGDPVEVLE